MNGRVFVEVGLRAGSVRIQRGEEGRLTIRGLLRSRSSIFEWGQPEDRLQRLASGLPIEQNGNSILIGDVDGAWSPRSVCFFLDVLVPTDVSVTATTDSADLRVEGIQGPVECESDSGQIEILEIAAHVEAQSDSGGIHIRRVGGSVDASTDSGEIEALEIGGAVDAESDSGNIQISQTAAAPINVSTDSGSISIKLASNGGYSIGVTSDSGRIELPNLSQMGNSRQEVRQEIRGGGSMVNIETDSGDVEVRLS